MDTKKVAKYVFSVVIASVMLYFSFRGVGWADFVAGLKSCRWELIALSMTASIFAFWLRALRWRGLLLPIDGSLKKRSVFNAINIGYISNFIFPRIGEFVRCGVITANSALEGGNVPRKKASYDKVLGTVVLERGWDMLTMLIFMLLVLVTGWNKFGTFFMEKMWEPAAGRFGFSLWWIVGGLVAVCFAVVAAMWRFRRTNAFCGKVWNVVMGLSQGIGSCLKMQDKWKFFLYTLLIWAMYWLMSYSTMRAMPVLDALGAADAMFLMVAGSFGWLVPVPGGFGAFHFVVSLALSTIYGIPFGTGIVFAALSHESQAITMVLCGGISYFDEMLRK